VIRAAIAVAVLSTIATVAALAAQGPGLVRSAGNAPGPDVKPEPKEKVSPKEFNGDLRKIPPGKPDKGEARPEPQVPNEAPGAAQGDPSLQTAVASAAAPSPTVSFDGLDYQGWGAGFPPDTNGDVGPNHYIETVNTSVGIFSKTGTRLAAFTFNSLFSQAATGTPCDNSNQGDPVVLYDPIGDRWVITDFAWTNFATGPFYQCFAVSKTGDPVTGGWYFYAYQTAAGAVLSDYPKLGVWPDGIYMSANNFASSGSGSFQNVQVWAFDRVAMEAGQPAGSITAALPRTVGGVTVFSLLPSNARTVTGLPPSGTPNYFASIYGSYNIRVWQFHVDWANPSSSTFTGPTNASSGTFNVGPPSVPEKTGNDLDTLSYRLMMQNQYTNIGGRESLWLTHTVGNGGAPNVAQVRWYELPVTGGTVALTPRQQATWGPDSKNRFMPSLAVDETGNMAIGYSVSDSTTSPAVRYAGRLASDPLSTLGQGETTLVQGTGYQCCSFSDGTVNTRWGDYSAMTIDPDGCTFWYIGEYTNAQPTTLRGPTGNNWQTRVGSFQLPGCSSTTPPPAPTVSSFNPTSGAVGATVTITGTNFTGASSVKFSGTSAAFTVGSSTQITATVPAGATTGPIEITTAGGTATSSSSFTVNASTPAPTISSFSPGTGRVGTTVTITGTNLNGATFVRFNGTAATFTVVSATSVQATVPSGATTGKITVTTPGGTATSSQTFKVRH
jgi:hypothetical protein